MALIKCPECEHEVSDTAITCPNCGYTLKKEIAQQKRASFFEQNKKTIIGVLLAVVVIGIIIAIIQNMPVKTPFEKIKHSMTLEEGRKLLGEPDLAEEPDSNLDSDLDGYHDTYRNISFMGMTGDMTVWYYSDDKTFKYATWIHNLSNNETFSTYEKPIKKMVDYFTEKYGTPTSDYYRTYKWTDIDGGKISLDLDREYNWIWLEYD